METEPTVQRQLLAKTDLGFKKAVQLGQSNETAAKMLKSWCGVHSPRYQLTPPILYMYLVLGVLKINVPYKTKLSTSPSTCGKSGHHFVFPTQIGVT